ncbi:MAG: TonB-dependent receptor plug domain-containing protein [Gammaproteobacteria bacterium]|nr:TonB-dependent receptor plug domain-containing protein [Gammaproteobacteria bacterium]MDE0225562.1 TonB-dependent receptor plug domain-containing protein [Gammaproteobacteria bacterium]
MAGRRPTVHALAACLVTGLPALAEENSAEPEVDETITVHGDPADRVSIVPSEPVDAVFGLDKSLFETPRSATSVAVETMDRLGMTDIDDLVMLSASSFTQSFFGVSGSLDLRGTSGENYFNGVRRLDNPGNYATPIGAADRVDIVRGPASVIHGPSKIGGYMNFVPKSARADTGQFLEKPAGEVSVGAGSWDRAVLAAEVGGPGELGDRRFGYYLFGEREDSGSYYRDTATANVILQATFNVDLGNRLRLVWGGMYHDYDGNEIGGWNRLTQDLIDHGTYLTGLAKPLDADADGFISHDEYDAANGGAGLFAFVVDPAGHDGPIVPGVDFGLDPDTVGAAKLGGDQVLVAGDDVLRTEDFVFYADVHFNAGPNWQVTNKLYFEAYDHLSEVAYGFAEFADSRVFEERLVIAYSPVVQRGQIRMLVSPSIRRTDFEHANDFANEHFDRRDLTGPSTARDRRLLATRIDRDYSDYSKGSYTSFGLAVLADFDWGNGLNAVIGVRPERIELDSRQPAGRTRGGQAVEASGTDEVLSWTASLSYRTAGGLMPYATLSEQTTVIAGQGAEILPSNVAENRAVATSRLREFGVKGAFLDGRLFAQAVYFEQERTDFSAQAIVTNQASRAEGLEFELRWRATERVSVIAARTNLEVINLNTLANGGRFSFLGAGDLPGTDPTTVYGGTIGGFVTLASNPDAVRAGVPRHLSAVTVLREWGRWRAYAGVADVASVYSGFSRRVRLPAYTLVNAGLQLDGRRWSITVSGKNLTDERYFRANFPNLFGGVVVLPELPRHFQATVTRKF